MEREKMAVRKKNLWFAYFCLAVGMIPLTMLGLSLWNWNRARSWVPTSARVVNVDLGWKNVPGARNRPSTAVTLSIQYEYELDNSVYQANELTPFNSLGVSGSEKRMIASELRDAKSKGQAITCFVNPDSAAEAYLDRQFKWIPVLRAGAIGVFFSGVGLVLARRRSERLS